MAYFEMTSRLAAFVVLWLSATSRVRDDDRPRATWGELEPRLMTTSFTKRGVRDQ